MELKVRQRWKFAGTNKFENIARLTICKMMEKDGLDVLYVYVTGLFRAGGDLKACSFAIDRESLEASLTELVEEVPLDDMDFSWRPGFKRWTEHPGCFQIPVADAIQCFERSIVDGIEVDDGEQLS